MILKNKFWFLITLIFLASNTLFLAQSKTTDAKDLEHQKKVAYLKEKVKLTSEEAKAFWPVYNQKYMELKANTKNYKSQKIDKKWSEMTELECKKMMDLKFAKETKELEIEKKYHDKFVAIIGYKKTAKIYKEEVDYKKEIKAKASTTKSKK